LAPTAREKVGGANATCKTIGYGTQHAVARAVTVLIVDALEEIHVPHGDARGLLTLCQAFQLLIDAFVVGEAIRNLRREKLSNPNNQPEPALPFRFDLMAGNDERAAPGRTTDTPVRMESLRFATNAPDIIGREQSFDAHTSGG
jgi:hypothetical protein